MNRDEDKQSYADSRLLEGCSVVDIKLVLIPPQLVWPSACPTAWTPAWTHTWTPTWTHTLRPVNDATEGSTQEASMCASCVLPRKFGKIV